MVMIKALLDSGRSGNSLVLQQYAKKLPLQKINGQQTIWTMPAGSLETTMKCKVQFMLPELHDIKMITWDLHVAKNLGHMI